ncbi:est [Symbiodinium natans]|uniref:Est protein n=1 Tax=Symbiodinium natans TaxID=878477 RepID=A0A812MCJ3_9DINO|nr:est [Symbiodinium natans]
MADLSDAATVRGLRDDNAMIGREHWKIVQEQIGHDAVRLSESAVGGIDCQWVHNCKGEGEQGKQDTGDQAPVILYFFGGAFVVGSPEDDLAITAKLAHFTRLSVCVPRYRRAPENPYPRAIEDAAAVYRELVGVQRRRVLLVGESAGGHLALRLLLDVLGDRELAAPEAVALLSPWADLSHSGDSHVVCQNLDPTLSVEHFLHPATCAYMGVPADASGTEKAKSPDVSPLFADMPARFPPVIITTGTRDLLMSDSIRLAAKLREAAAASEEGREAVVDLRVTDGMWHVFEWFSKLPEAEQSLRGIADFLLKHQAAVR